MFKSEFTKYYYIEDKNISGDGNVLKIICVDKSIRMSTTVWEGYRFRTIVGSYDIYDTYDLCKSIITNRKNALLNLRHADRMIRELCELILMLNRNINKGNKKWKRVQQN